LTDLAAIVVLTGESDYVSDGHVIIKASNGHKLVSKNSDTLDEGG
jgi:hydroxyethylthiazole kinase-like sugar kinase family protein